MLQLLPQLRGFSRAKAVQKRFSGRERLIATVVTLLDSSPEIEIPTIALPRDVFRRQRMGQSLIQSECVLCNRLIGVTRDPKLLSLLERLHSCPDLRNPTRRAGISDDDVRRRCGGAY